MKRLADLSFKLNLKYDDEAFFERRATSFHRAIMTSSKQNYFLMVCSDIYVIEYSDHHKLAVTYRPCFVCVKDACMHHVLTAAWLLRLVRAFLCDLSFFTELYEYVFYQLLELFGHPIILADEASLVSNIAVLVLHFREKGIVNQFWAIHRPVGLRSNLRQILPKRAISFPDLYKACTIFIVFDGSYFFSRR